MYTFLAILLIVIAMIVFTVRRGLHVKALATEGQPVQATVIKKWHHGQNKYRLRYEFTTPTQGTYSHSPWVTKAEYDQYNVNDPIDVVVLASNPKISAMASMVTLAKQGLAKKTDVKD